MHRDGRRWSGGCLEEGKRSPATLAASSSSSSNGVQNFFHDRCSDCPGFHGPLQGWLLTSRSARPDFPRSSGHLRTALNRDLIHQ